MFRITNCNGEDFTVNTIEEATQYVTDNQKELDWIDVEFSGKTFSFDDGGIQYSYEDNFGDIEALTK